MQVNKQLTMLRGQSVPRTLASYDVYRSRVSHAKMVLTYCPRFLSANRCIGVEFLDAIAIRHVELTKMKLDGRYASWER
jgi:hypothetical protein